MTNGIMLSPGLINHVYLFFLMLVFLFKPKVPIGTLKTDSGVLGLYLSLFPVDGD